MATRGKFSAAGMNRLSDRDMVFDLLNGEKQMSHLYDHALMEATSDKVRDTFIALQQDEQHAARMLFEFLQQRGWYTTGAGRQHYERRIETSQRLSGGSQARADSRYAATTGSRRFGQNLASRGQPQPQSSRSDRGRQEQYSRSGWNF